MVNLVGASFSAHKKKGCRQCGSFSKPFFAVSGKNRPILRTTKWSRSAVGKEFEWATSPSFTLFLAMSDHFDAKFIRSMSLRPRGANCFVSNVFFAFAPRLFYE
jgi:hypothetical protein